MKKVDLYVQEKDCINHVQNYLKAQKVLIILGAFNADVFQKKIVQSLRIPYECIVYDKECSEQNCKVLAEKMQVEQFDAIIGFGGGKVLDIAKAVSHYYPCFLLLIPSSASMDGACSALSVLYHEDHSFDRFLHLAKNPDVVLVDTQIIFDAPFSLLCAGMADAISSYCDCMYVQNKTALQEEVLQCAQNCHDIVFANYEQVQKDFANRHLSEAVEAMIKVNVYDSAVAFENAGCEFSHVLANASTKIKGSVGMHGERVGVATLFQLLLEQKEKDFEKVETMLIALQMPTRISHLKVDEPLLLMDAIAAEFKQLKIVYSKQAIQEALLKLK